LAKVTIVLNDVADGVSVKLESDPVVTDWDKLDETETTTDAQRMAVSMLRLFEHAHNQAEREAHEHEHGCCHGKGECGGAHKKEGVCARHNDTPPDECCQH
jgi:hypothetical protein